MINKDELIGYLQSWDPMRLIFIDKDLSMSSFPVLMEIALNETDHYSWRAAWAADNINEMFPGIANDWIKPMIDALGGLNHSGKKRQFLKLISLYPVPEDDFPFLTSADDEISVKVYSMQILYNISQREPDLKHELLELIEQEMEYRPKPGILTRGKKLASKLRSEIL
jgi:hypothetical protein